MLNLDVLYVAIATSIKLVCQGTSTCEVSVMGTFLSTYIL